MTASEEAEDHKRETVALPTETDTLKTHMIINLNSNMLMMSQLVGEMSVAVKEVALRITDVEERRRRDRVMFGFSLLIVVMVAGFIISQVQSNNQQLEILKRATSPAAAAASAANTQKVVRQIDCNDKINDRDLLLSVRDLAPNISIPEVPPDCEAIIEEMERSTTTTVKGN